MPQYISKKKISFHKTPTGGGGAPFYETFSQNRFFLKDGFPKSLIEYLSFNAPVAQKPL